MKIDPEPTQHFLEFVRFFKGSKYTVFAIEHAQRKIVENILQSYTL